MPLNLPIELRREKNKIASPNAWLLLLDVFLTSGEIFHFAKNTDDVTFRNTTYIAMPFNLDVQKTTSKGELPVLTLSVSNVTRVLQTYLENLNGAVGSSVQIILVNSGNLSSDYSDLEQTFDITGTDVTAKLVTFTLGAPNPLRRRFPFERYISSHCGWKFNYPRWTNFLTWSQDFTNPIWVTDGTSLVTPNMYPDTTGQYTADLFTKGGGTYTKWAHLSQQCTIPNAGTRTFTFSVYAAAVSGTAQVAVGLSDSTAYSMSSYTTVGTALTRVYLNYVIVNSTNYVLGGINVNGAAGSQVILWGAQLEEGSSPSNYIYTTTAAATVGKGPECAYTGDAITCKRTLDNCVLLGNQARFGGYLGLNPSGVRFA
jgi:phage-related protein